VPFREPSRVAMGAGALLVAGGTALLVSVLHIIFAPAGFLYVYVPVVAAVGYLWGRLPGWVAAIVSLAGAWFAVVSPHDPLSLPLPTEWPGIILFTAVAVVTAEGAVRLRRADLAARQLASIVESSDDAIFSKAPDGTILTWNPGAERLFGYGAAEALGRPVFMLAPHDRAGAVADLLARLRRGERFERYETECVKRDGSRVDVSLSISPIRSRWGAVVGSSSVARDITERKRVEQQRQLLVQIGDALSGLDVDANLDGLARVLVPALADWCIIDLTDDSGTLRTAITMHKDVDRAALAREVQRRYPPDPRSRYGAAHAVRTRKAELYADISATLLADAVPNPALRRIVRSLGARSAMVLPLVAHERCLGAITLFSAESARRHTEADLAFAEEVGRRAALALDNARLHRSEQLQRVAAERAADRVTRMQAITAALSEAVTPEQIADVIVAHAQETFGGSAASLCLLSADQSTLELVRAVGYPSEITQRWRRFPLRRPTTGAGPAGSVGAVWHAAGGTQDGRAPDPTPFMDSATAGALAEVPLISYGRVIGVLYVRFTEARRPPTDELEFMVTVGRQCGQAIERARPYARERRVAETLQRALLPGALPQCPGLALRSAYRSGGAWESDIGGDWYDMFWLPDGRIALSIGDVAGRGLRAAVTMGQLRQSIRAAALSHADPSGVLRRASDLLALTDGDAAMATALFGVMDPNTSELIYATAGCPAPILVVPDEEPARLPCGGLPLGYLGIDQPPSHSVTLPRGSLIVLYTDGLTETRLDPIVGEAAVIEAAREVLTEPEADHAEAIVKRVLTHGHIGDDIAVLTVAVAARPFDRFEIALPSEPRSAVVVRQALRRLAADTGLDRERLTSIMVAVGEAVNNVIEHAYGTTAGQLRVRAYVDERRTLRVEVADDGTWRTDRPFTGGGHGLRVMEALADAVEVQSTSAGTTVRLAMKLPHDSASIPDELSTEPGGAPRDGVAGAIDPRPTGGSPGKDGAGRLARGTPFGIYRAGEIPVVTIGGDMDLRNAAAFEAALDQAARADSRGVIVALTEAAYLDSYAIGALLRFGRRLATNRRELLLVVPSSAALRRLVHIAGVGQAFKTFGTLADAIETMRPVGEPSTRPRPLGSAPSSP